MTTTLTPVLQQTEAVAKQLVAYCRQQQWETAIEALYADDAVHDELMAMPGMPQTTRGKADLLTASAKWCADNTVHSVEIGDPLVSEGVFAVRMMLDVTSASMGNTRIQMSEIAVYRVNDAGKITHVNFFYPLGDCGQG